MEVNIPYMDGTGWDAMGMFPCSHVPWKDLGNLL